MEPRWRDLGGLRGFDVFGGEVRGVRRGRGLVEG